MAKVLLPSLSEDSWVGGTRRKLDYLFSHFLASDYSQSYIYYGNVSSYAKILQEKQGDFGAIASETETVLDRYFSRYFPEVLVECSDTTDYENDPSRGKTSIFLQVTDEEGKSYSLGKELQFSNMKVINIINLNNRGYV